MIVNRWRALREPTFDPRAAGQALVEFALVLVIVLELVFVLIDFGRVVYIQNGISVAAASAARFASVSAPQTDASIKQKAQGSAPIAIPLSAVTGGAAGNVFYNSTSAVVKIDLPVPLITPIIGDLVGNAITVHAVAAEPLH